MSTEAMHVQRGNCLKCGQTWVYGKFADEAGMYGEFYCAACWDRCEGYGDDALFVPFPSHLIEKTQDDDIEVSHARVGFPLRNRSLSFVRVNRQSIMEIYAPSTGYSVWTGAKALLHYMECIFKRRHRSKLQGVRILEVGAGCGLPGMGLAQLGAKVILTDMPELCRVLQNNVAINFGNDCMRDALAENRACRPHVASLRWGHPGDLSSVLELVQSSEGLDYVIGAELVYDDTAHKSLIQTLGALLSASKQAKRFSHPEKVPTRTRVLMTFALRPNEFEQFVEYVAEARWCLRILRRIDIQKMTGIPSHSPVLVVELRPRSKSCQLRSAPPSLKAKRRYRVLHPTKANMKAFR
jgi:predicted nicotinamide N-methyase